MRYPSEFWVLDGGAKLEKVEPGMPCAKEGEAVAGTRRSQSPKESVCKPPTTRCSGDLRSPKLLILKTRRSETAATDQSFHTDSRAWPVDPTMGNAFVRSPGPSFDSTDQ